MHKPRQPTQTSLVQLQNSLWRSLTFLTISLSYFPNITVVRQGLARGNLHLLNLGISNLAAYNNHSAVIFCTHIYHAL